jgi:pimeloyl-ACP methyl ester carboxylesterase
MRPARHNPNIAILAGLFALALCTAAPAPTGAQREVVFTETAPLAGNAELVRRLLSPLASEQMRAAVAASGKTLGEQSIALEGERFTVYVPPAPGPRGYGLLVFVPPWETAHLPPDWPPVLDRAGVIYVSAARSGNSANIFGRRAPLAVIAAANIMARYPVDPDRIYIGGFSGGSRVAMRLALGYPDLFRGAILDAGSDLIGEASAPLPPRELFDRFVTTSRLVYVTGGQDMPNLEAASASLSAMARSCMFNIDADITPHAGHEIMDGSALAEALGQLDRRAPSDPARLAACRAGLDAKVAAALDQTRAQLAAGHADAARGALLALDRRYGGLAAPASVDLWRASGAVAH